jgi:hypothetical protein
VRVPSAVPDVASDHDSAATVAISIIVSLRADRWKGVRISTGAVVEQPPAAQFGENLAAVASGMAVGDERAIAVAQCEGRASAPMNRTPTSPPHARAAGSTQRMGDLGRVH